MVKQKIEQHLPDTGDLYYKDDFTNLKEFVPDWERFKRIIGGYAGVHKP